MIDKTFFDVVRKAQATGEPVARYKKGIVGRVGLQMIDTFTGKPIDITLTGDITDPNVPIEDITITLWTELEHDYFRRANRILLEQGFLVPFEAEVEVVGASVNEVSERLLSAY